MLYVASLGRDGLLKVGVSRWHRFDKRESELRRELLSPRLRTFIKLTLPWGWGTDEDWEKQLIGELRSASGNLQLFASDDPSTEVVEATPNDARKALRSILSETEIDQSLDASQLNARQEDWRFCFFMSRRYPHLLYSTANNSRSFWRDASYRKEFMAWLLIGQWNPDMEQFFDGDIR